ncbi:MAG: CPBP family intramembrane metalloprotease [Deltaproteobacteria bacterium]|nr:CPBP family intramembrane metalloprotease [Deltaproteobacteria bacterium]MBI3295174.1 CPBP family intramembrane metalloprotease [Deltaproteobacteria bacterium]
METGKKVVVKVLHCALLFSLTLSALCLADSFYTYPNEPLRKRNMLGRPWVSFLLPGFDQWVEGQTSAATVYSGLALAGIATVLAVQGDSSQYVTSKDDRARTTILGAQIYQTMGSLSTFHAFRSGLVAARAEGAFPEMASEETPAELLCSPFRIDYFIRPTTFLPLLVVGALVAVDANAGGNNAINFSTADGFFAGAFSYQAGLGEEALFRGVLQPTISEYFTERNALAANFSQALIFAALHYSSQNRLPWPQFLLGFYLGWLTQHNNYTLSENIFLHTWWDVVAIGASYALSQTITRPTTFFFPLIETRF